MHTYFGPLCVTHHPQYPRRVCFGPDPTDYLDLPAPITSVQAGPAHEPPRVEITCLDGYRYWLTGSPESRDSWTLTTHGWVGDEERCSRCMRSLGNPRDAAADELHARLDAELRTLGADFEGSYDVLAIRHFIDDYRRNTPF